MRFRAGPAAVGVLLAAASAGLLAGLPFVGPVGRRLGVTGAIVAGFAIMATGNLLTAAPPWLIAAVAAQVLRGLAIPLRHHYREWFSLAGCCSGHESQHYSPRHQAEVDRWDWLHVRDQEEPEKRS
jgi:MFS family permease